MYFLNKYKIIININSFTDFTIYENIFYIYSFFKNFMNQIFFSFFIKKKSKNFTILKSVFVNKKSKVNLISTTYKGTINIFLDLPFLNKKVINYIIYYFKQKLISSKIFIRISLIKTSFFF